MMENVVGIQSPKGTHGANKKAEGSRSCHSDWQHTVLSDDSCRSRGYSSDSSRPSSSLTGSKTSKCHRECKAGGSSSVKTSDRLDVLETATPHQSPQQKQLKMTDLEAQSAMPTPTEDESSPQPRCHLSSQVVCIQIAEQGVIHSAVQCTEARMEAVNDLPRSLSPLAWMWWRLDTGLCVRNPYFWLNQILTKKQMEILFQDHQDEYIYQLTYKINSRKYDHYHDDLKVFGNNAKELLLQVIMLCTWAQVYHDLTECTLDPYLLYMLWSISSRFAEWKVPTMDDLTHHKYCAKCKEWWKYLIILLQFWTDNNATIQIRGSPIWLMSGLAKLIKDTANCILPMGFHISWKHIIENMPWYRYQDYERMSAIMTPHPKQCLEEVMLHYNKKVCQLLKYSWRSCPSHSQSSCQNLMPPPIMSETPVEGQFDDLGQDPYDLLKTPTNTPIQDESITPVQDDTVKNTTMSTMVTEEENHLLDDEDDNISIVSSQGKRWQANFTSLMYRQEELLNRGDVTDFSPTSPSFCIHQVSCPGPCCVLCRPYHQEKHLEWVPDDRHL